MGGEKKDKWGGEEGKDYVLASSAIMTGLSKQE